MTEDALSLKAMPKGLLEALQAHGYFLSPLAFAGADMDKDGELRSSYLLFSEESLVFALHSRRESTADFGAGYAEKTIHPKDLAEIYQWPLSELADPKILNQVVGGLLTIDIDGEETWICRFSSSRMREMRRFVDYLAHQLDPSRALPEDEKREDTHCPKCGRPYPEHGRAVCPHCMEKGTIMARILAHFRDYRWRVAVMLLCIIASGVLNAIYPYLTGTLLYDKVLGRDEAFLTSFGLGGQVVLALGLLVVVMMGTKLLQQITGIVHGRMTAYIVPGVVSKIKSQVFSALQRLSIGFFTRRQTGSLMQRVNGDANQVMSFFIDGLPYLLFNVLTLLVATVIMFVMEWRLALVALFMLPPLFMVSYWLLPRLWHAHDRRSRQIRSMYSVLNDGIVGARVVKAFGQEKYEDQRFGKVNATVRDAEMNLVRYENAYSIAYILARDVPNLLVWCVGALLILFTPGHTFTYGQLLTFTGYLSLLQGPMEFFSHIFQWWAQSMNAAQRIFEIIDARPDVVEKSDAVDVKLKGNIELRQVNFSYEPNHPVLQDISFTVRAGEMLGIVGRSGAGKSTLVNLISRLYDTESGEILLDGHNIRDLSFASLRGSVAMVSQETYIFMGTISENIAYAKPNATREEIVRAAVAASAHGFICRLPDGYDTLIGAGGRQLSGGERQRLSIARAILADPQILILDEATASVDTETERAIQASLDQLIQGRTTISIAHRLSTLRSADHLVVLENGRLVESGRHEELVAQKGVYYKLLQLQSKALAMRGIGD